MWKHFNVLNGVRVLMHPAIVVSAILAAWKWGDWRNFQKYYPTMLYVLSISMIYEFLTKDFAIWTFHPDFLFNQAIVVLLHAVISVPFTIFIFLSRYPTEGAKIFFHYLIWIGIYIGAEEILSVTRRITYEHGWSLWSSLVFDCIMFPMIRLHYKKPIIAWIFTFPIVIAYMFIFKVPIK